MYSGSRAQTTRDDHAAIFVQGLANRLKAFGLGAVQKPAGVHDHGIRAAVVGRNSIAFGTQPGQDAFAVHQCLWAPQRHHTDGGLAGTAIGIHTALGRCVFDPGLGREIGAEVWRICAHTLPLMRSHLPRKGLGWCDRLR